MNENKKTFRTFVIRVYEIEAQHYPDLTDRPGDAIVYSVTLELPGQFPECVPNQVGTHHDTVADGLVAVSTYVEAWIATHNNDCPSRAANIFNMADF